MENPQESQEIIWVCVKGVRPEKRKFLNPSAISSSTPKKPPFSSSSFIQTPSFAGPVVRWQGFKTSPYKETIDGWDPNQKPDQNQAQGRVRALDGVSLVTGLKKTRPDILPEFKAKFALLQKEKPLPEEAQAVVNEMFKEVFGA